MPTAGELTPASLLPAIERMWSRSAEVLHSLENFWNDANGSPVITVRGRYTTRGWTEWTQGFRVGSLLLQFDATDDTEFLHLGRRRILDLMPSHVSHVGVHDHGFNNVSTYGNLRRLMLEGRCSLDEHLVGLCELALKVSGAVQAARWTKTADGGGYIYSFNGPHSLFCDTIRSLRSLALAHQLGHRLMSENDEPVSLLARLIDHAEATARYAVYDGSGRDIYDIPGRVAHESLFNTNGGVYRCPSTQQGYSPFSTWTRGLAWIILGYAEQLEFIETVPDEELEPFGGRRPIENRMSDVAERTCRFHLDHSAADGIPYWDAGAPGLSQLGDWRSQPADPFNDFEPVDSSAAAIACQGLIRLGLWKSGRLTGSGEEFTQAGLRVLSRLLENYVSEESSHQGLLIHSVYHRPRGWDHIPEGRKVPCGESSQWGDYHLREAALMVQRLAHNETPYRFNGPGN